MKKLLKHATDARIAGSGLRLAIVSLLLLTALPLAAATLPTYTGTGYVVGVPVPGILCTNASGQVSIKGNVHVLRVQVNDARLTGRFQAAMDLAYQADGTAIFGGAAYQEVGTWDVADLLNPKFTPTGGMWQCNYHGVAQPDGSDVITLTGYGVGGAIDGLRLEETITKGPGVPFDPAIPYLGAATIMDPPVNTRVVLDDFEDGILKPQWVPWSSGTIYPTEANGQLKVRGVWNRPVNDVLVDHAGMYWVENWSVPEGQTVEWRADVLGMNQDAGYVGLGAGTGGTRYYQLQLASDSVSLYRWTATGGNVLLFSDPAIVRQTNIVLCFALTRHQSQAVVTIRVEDRTAPGVLYKKNYLDVSPFLSGNNSALGVAPKPELQASDASASYDNFELRTYEVPQVGIERAVQLTWPAPTGMNYAVEGGPTVQGPWLPVNDVATPGLKQMTVPANDVMKFFRLQQAP